MIEVNGKTYDDRHGGPFDRGVADSYYWRPRKPHFYLGYTSMSPEVTEDHMTAKEIAAYNAGYDYNEFSGDKKDWGY